MLTQSKILSIAIATLTLITYHTAYGESPEMAASRFFQIQNGVLDSPQKVRQYAHSSDTQEGVRVFNNLDGEGWVMLAPGQSYTWHVIAYSMIGKFECGEKIPKEFYQILYKDSSKLKNIAKNKAQDFQKVSPVWGPLLTTRWGQSAPYNKFLPYCTTAQTHALAGCTTVAIAQLMYYYRYPENSRYRQYQWDKMRDVYDDGGYTEDEADAVGELMADLTQEAITYYGVEATSGFVPLYMDGYSRISVEPEDLFEFLESSTEPQVLSLEGQGVGHLVVMDGVDTNGFYHINWGWSGTADGWYSRDFIETVYIIKNREKEDQRLLSLDSQCYRPSLVLKGGVTVDKSSVLPGEEFTVSLNDIAYINTSCFGFKYGNHTGVAFGLFLYESFPWVWDNPSRALYRNRDWNNGYLGKRITNGDLRYWSFIATKYGHSYKDESVQLKMSLPNIPEGQTYVIRPENYLYWPDNSIYIRKFKDDPYTIGASIDWYPFWSNSTTCILSTMKDGRINLRPISIAELVKEKYYETLSVENLQENSAHERKEIARFNLMGHPVGQDYRGITIIHYSDGSVTKVMP